MPGDIPLDIPRDAVFVHPRGLCESDEVGAGTRVWAFAHVLPGARVGRDCNICDCAFIENGAILGDRARQKGWVCACGERLDADLVCPSCGTKHEPVEAGLRPVS